MSGRKKIIILIASLSVLIVALVTTLIVVLVAQQQNAKALISVKYTASKVSLEVSAKYYTNDMGVDMYVTEDGVQTEDTVLVFNSTEDETGVLTPKYEIEDKQYLELTKANPKLVFEYKFVNKSDQISINTALVNADIVTENMTVKYAKSVEQLSYSTITSTEYEANLYTSYDNENINKVLDAGVDNAMYIYIVVTIDDLLYDANYSGEIGWSLTRYIENV